MSRATCVVRFPDGEIRVATYNGTSDVVSGRLHTVGEWEQRWRDADTSNPWVNHWPEDFLLPEPTGEVFTVELACNYAFGMTGTGYATKEQVLGPCRDGDHWSDDLPTAPGTDLPIWWPWPIEDWDRRFSE